MAKLGHARSLMALCPAGLWRTRTPRYCIVSFRFSCALSHLLGRSGARLATSTAAGRTIVMSQYFGRPWKIPVGEAAELQSGNAKGSYNPAFGEEVSRKGGKKTWRRSTE
jgi:hypothetical protein